ncbi:MAG: alpha-hydroxy acid oxidase [Nocardioidaceae bacterium]
MSRWVDGLEAAAQEKIPEPVHRYFRQGAADGVSAAEATAAWRSLRFWPRVLRDVSGVDTQTSVLGSKVSAPILVAPTSLQREAHPGGEAEMADGVEEAGSLVCVSSNAGLAFSDIAGPHGLWWVQAYVLRDRGLTQAMLDRAVEAGARAVVLTVDTPVVGAKDDDGPTVWDTVPADHQHANVDTASASDTALEKAADLTPDDIGWLVEATGLPVVVKGVLRADDAHAAVRAGAAGVWVSNHGGRQLDQAVPTAVALRGVADAVGDQAEVYVDGGVRSGRDVLAALALGARAVFLGRPPLWALCCGGRQGVSQLLQVVAEELSEAMTLGGCASVEQIGGDLLGGRHLPCDGHHKEWI